MNSDELATEAEALAARIAPLLAGHDPMVQSAALADLTATYLAGNVVPGNQALTDRLRRILLIEFVKVIERLVPVNEHLLRERMKHR